MSYVSLGNLVADGKDVSWGNGGMKTVWGKISFKQMNRIRATSQLGSVAYEFEQAFFHCPQTRESDIRMR